MSKTIADYSPPHRPDGPITDDDLSRIKSAWLDRHCGLIDDATLVAVMTQYVDLLIEAAEMDIRARSRHPRLSR